MIAVKAQTNGAEELNDKYEPVTEVIHGTV